MNRRLASTMAITLVLVFGSASQAFAGSYRAQIEQYVNARTPQARIVQLALERAGWGYDTPAEKTLMRQAILVAAGESGMNPVNDRNKSCSGLFQIQGGKRAYGVWTAEELSDPDTVAHYTITDSPWRFGLVRTYANGAYTGIEMGWYVKAGRTGAYASDWAYGPVKAYEDEEYIGNRPGWYRAAPVSYYPPRVGDYKIFNPVFNAEIALRMYNSRGWQPWTVARKLGL